MDPFTQEGFRCRLEWGRRGARAASVRGDVLVVVDVLSFSTAVTAALAGGGVVVPCPEGEDAAALAARIGAEAAVGRRDVPAHGRFSLSPLSYAGIAPGTRVVLGGPNGATCARYGREAPTLLLGSLVNAPAAGSVLQEMLAGDPTLGVTILACGERWRSPSEDGTLRVALEDMLGAGAVLAHLAAEKSPEARLCESAFLGARDHLAELLWECGSGRELRQAGFSEDVRCAARLGASDVVPVLRGDSFVPREPRPAGSCS